MMGIVDTFLKLYVEGGIEICTYSSRDTDGPGNRSRFLLARTFIQPDADVVTHLSEKILTMPDEWQTHIDTLQTKMVGMQRFRRLIGSIWMAFPAPLMLGSYKAWNEFAQHNVFELLRSLAPHLVLSTVLLVFKYTFTLFFQWCLRRKIRSAWGSV